ncbi:aldo/keto reductase [Luteolibacter sp. GHJ8]|uniref:Aldo/keto reductase n=1 Tax=Luteolibacter rhizosphaerae TaxID=2989719 RepID=A0ABT3G3L2_9BACT|nr:aldo/keto reductase [Luteolibacter rhizosphaerae]MCW1914086.1 aldo/keto reductase [Luteolibacter rhizosphaerae]
MTRRDSIRVLAAGATSMPAIAADDASPQMNTRAIPSSGEKLPVIGMGTWQTFDVGPKEAAPLEIILQEFASRGGKLLDSSPMYGRSEEVAGAMIRKFRLWDKLFVATKVWTTGKQEGIKQMESSMEKLVAKPLDLMQVHNLQDVATHLQTLRDWRKDGLVRYLGITHYTASQHGAVEKLLESETLDFVQINYSVGERDAEKRLLPLAKDRGVAVIANRPFAGGELIKGLTKKPLPDWAGELGCTTWAQLLLKWVVSHPAMTCAIPATSKIGHLRDNMAAGRGAMPDEKMRAEIAAAALA